MYLVSHNFDGTINLQLPLLHKMTSTKYLETLTNWPHEINILTTALENAKNQL